jgi:hypothetical protein
MVPAAGFCTTHKCHVLDCEEPSKTMSGLKTPNFGSNHPSSRGVAVSNYCESRHACPVRGCGNLRQNGSPCCTLHLKFLIRLVDDYQDPKYKPPNQTTKSRQEYIADHSQIRFSRDYRHEGNTVATTEVLQRLSLLRDEDQQTESFRATERKCGRQDCSNERDRDIDSGFGSRRRSRDNWTSIT